MRPLWLFWFGLVAFDAAPSVRAQLVVYSFTGNTTSATSVDLNLTASAWSGSGQVTLSNTSPVFSAGSGSYFASQSGWTGTAPGSTYFEFTLTPATGQTATVTSVSFGARATSTGPTSYAIRSSQDGFATNLLTSSLANDASWRSTGSQSVTLTFTEATTFRLYGSGASSGSGTLRVDDFTIEGSMSAVPEPSTYALLAGSAALLGTWWHRRRTARLMAAAGYPDIPAGS